MPTARIAGTGRAIPGRCVTNEELTRYMDTSDEWIQQRSGIRTRYWIQEGESCTSLATEACAKAIAAAGMDRSDIDLIILATLSGDCFFPGTSAFLTDSLGLPGVPAMDIRNQCSGFLYALASGDALIRAGMYRRILVVGVEIHSTGLDISTQGRDLSVLFGDGAGALVLEATEGQGGILSTHLHADGRFARALWAESPSSAHHPVRVTAEMLKDGRIYPRMEGRLVFKHAVVKLPEVIQEALDRNGVPLDAVDHFLFHQANLRINEFVAASLGIPESKVHNNIQKYGNTSAAAIPILLDELVESGRVEAGHLLMLAGFGSGFTWGSCLVRW